MLRIAVLAVLSAIEKTGGLVNETEDIARQ